jgi:poly-gamma-glutamate capsule biosynthesis protein CapA/YwtB (metallophosphatase superfamily)
MSDHVCELNTNTNENSKHGVPLDLNKKYLRMKEIIKILFTGDFYGGRRIDELIQREKYESIFNGFIDEIRGTDISITNLEAPLTHYDRSIQKTGPALKAHPKTAKALSYAGFNMVTLANNHIMDFGKQGLLDTFSALRSDEIEYIGAGKNLEEAKQPIYKEIKGKVLAFLNMAENEWSTTHGNDFGTSPLNPVQNYYIIQEAKKKADYVFVIVHGGHEMHPLPSPRMKETYRFFIDAGAVAVIGHHSHCYSGYEKYKTGYIFYSLGNFIFDNENKGSRLWNEGYAVQLDIIKGDILFKLIPYIQNAEQVGVNMLDDDEASRFFKKLNELNEIILDDTQLKYQFDRFCMEREVYNFYLEPHNNLIIHYLQKHKFLPSLLTKRKRLLLKNLIRCESHRDVVLNILEK